MSADEFRHDWGDIYDQLLAAERAKAITPLNDRYLLERIRPLVQRIQDFLQGRGNESSEVRGYLRLDLYLLHPGDVSRRRSPVALRQQG